jgi:hypothetical protein
MKIKKYNEFLYDCEDHKYNLMLLYKINIIENYRKDEPIKMTKIIKYKN